jgi:hypothetical protein
MAKRQPGSQPTWTDVKTQLASFDRPGLLDLIRDLYAAHKDNQTFLHARLGMGEDVLKPYQETLDRWLWPDVLRNQDTSVAKAKQAISSYKKAVGKPSGLAELAVFYCERAAGSAVISAITTRVTSMHWSACYAMLTKIFERLTRSAGSQTDGITQLYRKLTQLTGHPLQEH